MSSTRRRRGPNVHEQAVLGFLATVNALAVFVAVWAVAQHGRILWAVGIGVALIVLDAVVFRELRKQERGHVDRAARYLERPERMARQSKRGVTQAARDIGYGDLPTPGLFLGKSVRGQRELWSTWEDMYVEISGPGTGKTTARAIPNIIAAPGPALVTSCKHHVVEATRAIRERHGRTWVFDPQNVSGERPTWFWSPLSMVDGDIKDATTIAGLFMSTQRKPHHRTDAYFEPAAQSLIALMLFAADAGKLPITVILKWLMRPTDDTPLNILRDVGRHDLAAQAYEGLATLPGEQQTGVYGAAIQYMGWLGVPEIVPWVTPGEGREEFQFVSFARKSTDTLYVMSRTDDKTASPAVSALTAATVVAGATGSAKMIGGRLEKPLLVVLDEPANVAQLMLWPNRYSHFGSRGIIVMTMLQSWAQGVDVWGAQGMAKLWGAASVRVCGGGGSESKTVDGFSTLSGVFEPRTLSVTRSGFSMKSFNLSSREENVLDPADVAKLPRDRVLIQVGGRRPVLAESKPWTSGPYADDIRASIEKYRL